MITNYKIFEQYWSNENGASGLILIAKDTKKIGLGIRSKDVLEPGKIGNFGGAIGKNYYGDEEEPLPPKENAIKEFIEETGYSGEILNIIPSYIFRDGSFVYYNFIAIVPTEFDRNPNAKDAWEIDDVVWYDLDEIYNLGSKLHFGVRSLLDNSYSQIKDLIYNI